jgi:hypothetical protein
VTGNQDFNNNVNVDGTLKAGATEVSSLKVNNLAIESGYIPIPGMIVMYSGPTVPTGWLLCNGQATTGYPNLISVVGANVPDLRDKFVVGAGSSFNLKATGGGYATGGAGDHNHSTNGVSGSYTTNDSYSEHSHNTYHDHSAAAAGTHDHNGSTGSPFSNTNADSGNLRAAGSSGHGHNFNTSNAGSHGHYVNPVNPGSSVAGIGHSHTGSFNTNGANTSSQPGNHTHSLTPAYYALTYIIKT